MSPGERELSAFAAAQTGLDEEYLAADTRPGKACHNARIAVALIAVAAEDGLAEQVLSLLLGDGVVARHFSLCNAKGYAAEQLVDLLLQTAHAALAGVAFDDEFQGRSCHLQSRVFLQTVLLAILRHKMPSGYLYLFLRDVTVNLDEFHAIE